MRVAPRVVCRPLPVASLTSFVARAVPAPVVLYNIPGRTGVDLSAETTERICAAAPNVVASARRVMPQ